MKLKYFMPPLVILIVTFFSGCSGTMHEVITSDPHSADIYWGQSQSDLKQAGYKTPNSRSVSKSSWDSGCYQIKKDGYHDSKVICREKEGYRHVDVRLIPLKTIITSDPPNATIFWGPSRDKLKKTKHMTPRTEVDISLGANWKDWYYQVKKAGYFDSDIVFNSKDLKDRHVHFELKPTVGTKPKPKVSPTPKTKVSPTLIPTVRHYTVSGTQATLAWDDQSGDEHGFKIERKTGSEGTYREIRTVGPNVTTYTDKGLSKSTSYYYRVRAYNANGHSPYCKEISVKTANGE